MKDMASTGQDEVLQDGYGLSQGHNKEGKH